MLDRTTPARIVRRAQRARAGLASVVRSLSGAAAGWMALRGGRVAVAAPARVAGGAAPSRRGSTIVLVVSSLALFAVITVAYVGLGIGDRRTGAVTVASTQVDDVAGKVRDYLADVIGRDATAVFVEESVGRTPGRRIVREAWDYPWTDPNRVSDRRASLPGGGTAIRFDPAGTMPRDMVERTRGGGAQSRPEVFAASDPWLASTEPTWLPEISGGSIPTPSDPYYLDLTSWWQISNFAPDGRFVNLYSLRGNFDAAPGIRSGEMSEYLGLLNAQGRSQSGRHNTIHGVRADKFIPAHWTMFQQGAARPVGPGLDASGRFLRVNEPGYALYSWADVDGDGILDSRWFELVDAYNASRPDGIVSLLPRDNRWRWFVAARAIDLSSLVNINTALDVSDSAGASASEPTARYPIGLTPSDIDALRLFTLEDEFSLNPNSAGYGDIHQPLDTGLLSHYGGYSSDFDDADRIGQKAYQAIKEGAKTGVVPAPGTQYQVPPEPEHVTLARDRQEHYIRAGAARPGGARWERVGGSGRQVNSAAFGIQDLVELLTYHGLNDPATVSRLEQMAGGRDDASRQFSPFRDNRSLEIERLADVGPNPGSPSPDGRLDPERLALLAMDPRRRLTTISGAAQRRSSVVYPSDVYSATQEIPDAIAAIHTDEAPGRAHATSVLELASRIVDADPGPLFRAYAGALLPGGFELADLIAGGVDPWSDARYRTMFYGYDPIFALRAAAHMTVNRIDSWDEAPEGSRETPTALTLLINGNDRAAVEGSVAFPWPILDLEADSGAEMLPTGSAPAAVNVYGVEAQPFLVEAASFIMYTDTPFGQGSGDQEWTEATGGPGPLPSQSIPGPATINGNVSTANSDFLFQAIAFQITNPFDESLSLEDHRLEFAGNRYSLNELGTGAAIIMAPRETVLVYYLSEDKEKIRDRMRTAAYAPSFIIEEEHVERWVEYQFKGVGLTTGGGPAGDGRVRVIELVRNEPGFGGFGQVDLLAGSHGDPAAHANRTVLLWRTLDTPAGGQHNMLVDRLRDPQPRESRPTLDRRLPTGQNAISGTSVSALGDQDDEGYSLTLWGSIRRPEDPKAIDGAEENPLPRGGLPAYCIEARFGSGRGGQLNIEEIDDFGRTLNLSKGQFDPATSQNGEQRLDSLMQRQMGQMAAGADPQRLISNLRFEPWAKKDGTQPWSLSTIDQADQIAYWSAGAATEGLDPELHVGPQRSEPLRLGDMLMTMAVGPVEDPQDPEYLSSGREEEKWTTLAESLALALGYDELGSVSGGEPGPGGGPVTVAGPTPNLWYKTDRGFLRLDDFTPFYDADGNGEYDPAGSGDLLRGDGVPMALKILDAFRPSLGAGDSEQFGSLTNAATGVININTAPLSVLRTLGLLSPTASGRDWLVGSPHDAGSDIAATVMAYRDKTLVYPREFPGPAANPVSFVRITTAPRGVGDTDEGVLGGRAEHTGIAAVREQPGFRSLGEVMLARDLEFSGGGPVVGGSGGYPAPHDIDRFALTDAMTADGVESFLYRDTTGQRRPDALARDYDEKLAIFNSIAGSISVRSDLFAVWFVLHGYQREDVEGLTNDDPLIPSVAKRFLMIVDRSNVTTEGERPRILHFQELPL